MGVKTYDPKLVAASFRGVPLTGFAPDTFVTASRNNDTWSINIGAQGDGTRTKMGDKSGRVEMTFLAESETNATLTAYHLLDEQTGTGLGALLVKDLSGGDSVLAETAWIVKPADQEKANSGSNRTWIFETENLEITNAGIPLTP